MRNREAHASLVCRGIQGSSRQEEDEGTPYAARSVRGEAHSLDPLSASVWSVLGLKPEPSGARGPRGIG